MDFHWKMPTFTKAEFFVELCCFHLISYIVLDPLISRVTHRGTSVGSSFVVKALTYKLFSLHFRPGRTQRSYTFNLFCVHLSH